MGSVLDGRRLDGWLEESFEGVKRSWEMQRRDLYLVDCGTVMRESASRDRPVFV